MNICTIAKSGSIGETSSKYGHAGGGDAFIADLEAAKERSEKLWMEFIDFMKSRNVDPRILRELFTRYYEEFLKEETT